MKPRLVKLARRAIAVLCTVTLVPLGSCSGQGASGGPDVEEREGDLENPGDDPPVDVEGEIEILRQQAPVFDVATPVGTLPGSASVDRYGQASYTIPLDVGVGVGSMVPELTLTYNSGSGNGLLGIGFALAGLESAIMRCPKTLALDGAHERVEFDLDDALCLDGERLVLHSGAYGESGSEYRTRHDPFEKIVLHGLSLTRDSSFEVFLKDGRILTYGTPAAELVLDLGGDEPVPYRWALLEERDRFGNTIQHEYTHFFDDVVDVGRDADAVPRRREAARQVAEGAAHRQGARVEVRGDVGFRPFRGPRRHGRRPTLAARTTWDYMTQSEHI